MHVLPWLTWVVQGIDSGRLAVGSDLRLTQCLTVAKKHTLLPCMSICCAQYPLHSSCVAQLLMLTAAAASNAVIHMGHTCHAGLYYPPAQLLASVQWSRLWNTVVAAISSSLYRWPVGNLLHCWWRRCSHFTGNLDMFIPGKRNWNIWESR